MQVKPMKTRIFSLFLALVLLLSATPTSPAEAATLKSYAGAVTTASSPLNVRASAQTNSQVLTTLPKGSHITLINRQGSWWYVEYGQNRYGYCHADYITPIEGTPVSVTAKSGLNIRAGRGTGYAIQGVLSYGDVVIRLNTQNGWSRILYHGTKTGYVSDQYLSTGTQSPSQPSGYSAISLNVPSFKQYDSRWANTTIGTSGKTFSQIGCTTTGIAMIESYRTGTTIYPNLMAEKLRYTSGGSVYWPSHFQVTATKDRYLEKIYTLLKAGKPVLIGGATNAGGQHWVVITGFTGGELTEANFTIHDPGSQSRTRLQQFISAYPVFYKYFSY